MPIVARSGLVLVAYCVLGWLALLLAIPPGYATPVWPAAGLALAATLTWGPGVVPAVGVASFVVNLIPALVDSNGRALWSSVVAAVGIGVGAAVQAYVGAWLIRRVVQFPPALGDAREVGKILLLGGPLGCVLSATLGVGTLLATGTLVPSQLGFSWFTWWVGDTIGVLVVLPAALVEVARPADLWRRRRLSLGVPILLGCALLVGFFVYASDREALRVRADFRRRTGRLTHAILGDLRAHVEALAGLGSFVGSGSSVDADALQSFTRRGRLTHPSFRVLEWSRGADVPRRADVGNTAEWQAACARARSTGTTAVTAPFRAVADGATAVALVAPVVTDGAAAGALRGWAIAVLDVRAVVTGAIRDTDRRGIDIQLTDVTVRDGPVRDVLVLPWGRSSAETPGPMAAPAHRSTEPTTDAMDESQIRVGHRTWLISYAPSADFAFLHKSWDAWTVLAVGLLFTSLLGAFQLTVTGTSVAVEGLQLQGAEALRTSEAKLRASLAEKDVLLSEIHHRVKNNLQVISSLLTLQFPETPVMRGVEEMQSRIASIALVHERLYQSSDLARIGLAEYLRSLTEALVSQHGLGPERVRFSVSAAELRLGVGAAIPCGLIANELITNCLKHAFPPTPTGVEARGPGHIEVELTEVREGYARLVVADDGVGMPPGKDVRAGATTLGLRLVATLATQLGGTLTIDGDAGTRVSVEFPIT